MYDLDLLDFLNGNASELEGLLLASDAIMHAYAHAACTGHMNAGQ